jgi:hypothetical protein
MYQNPKDRYNADDFQFQMPFERRGGKEFVEGHFVNMPSACFKKPKSFLKHEYVIDT